MPDYCGEKCPKGSIEKNHICNCLPGCKICSQYDIILNAFVCKECDKINYYDYNGNCVEKCPIGTIAQKYNNAKICSDKCNLFT